MKRECMVIDSRLEAVSALSDWVSSLCRCSGFDKVQCYQVSACTVEAVNNSIIHACRSRSGMEVSVVWLLMERELRIQISDEGAMMQVSPELKAPGGGSLSGRGWFIMNSWMDRVEYCSDGRCNTVTLVRTLKRR